MKPGGVDTIAVDFDGVIHAYDGWRDGVVYGEPIEGAIEGLCGLRRMGYNVVVLTSRTDTAAVQSWFHRYLPEGEGKFVVTNVKPPALLYVDDRALRFESWAQVMEAVSGLE